MRIAALTLFFALAGAAVSAHATNITYNVNLNFGGATATGTVTTDGALGTLTQSDLVGFDLTLSDGVTTLHGVDGMISFDVAPLTATADDLLFDFTNSRNGLLFWMPNSSGYLCFVGTGWTCSGAPGTAEININNTHHVSGDFSGVESILTSNASANAPEPGSLMLAATGLVGALGVARRRLAGQAA